MASDSAPSGTVSLDAHKEDEELIRDNFPLLKKKADNGDMNSQYLVGRYYDEYEINKRKAALYYAKAADQGHAIANNNLGTLFAQGSGVGRSLVEAEKLFNSALALGCLEARQNLSAINPLLNEERNLIEERKRKASSNKSLGVLLLAGGILFYVVVFSADTLPPQGIHLVAWAAMLVGVKKLVQGIAQSRD